MTTDLDTPWVYFRIADDILYATYKKNNVIDLSIAKQIVQARIDFTQDKDMLVVIYIEGLVTIDKTARDFISSAEGVKRLIAAAIIIDSPFAATMGNFFNSINRPKKIPVRLCTNTDAAVTWLRKKSKHLQTITKKSRDGQANP